MRRYDVELDYIALGIKIKKCRIKKGYSQKKLAELAEISVTHISNIENGNTKVSLLSLVLIANALETGLDALLCDSLSTVTHILTRL